MGVSSFARDYCIIHSFSIKKNKLFATDIAREPGENARVREISPSKISMSLRANFVRYPRVV